MSETYIFEGKTSTEAIEKGLKELKVSKNKVDIKVLEQEDKRSFFSILTPRVVKVEMKLKDIAEEEKTQPVKEKSKKENKTDKEENVDAAISRISKFLDEFISKMPQNELKYEINQENGYLKINIDGKDTGFLIGYRGEVLNAVQAIISNIASKETKLKVLVNIGGYREKREKDLEVLAMKIAGTVIKTKKSITLEPMTAYERKIIHLKLQDNDKVKTYSIGEEPYRKIVVTMK